MRIRLDLVAELGGREGDVLNLCLLVLADQLVVHFFRGDHQALERYVLELAQQQLPPHLIDHLLRGHALLRQGQFELFLRNERAVLEELREFRHQSGKHFVVGNREPQALGLVNGSAPSDFLIDHLRQVDLEHLARHLAAAGDPVDNLLDFLHGQLVAADVGKDGILV